MRHAQTNYKYNGVTHTVAFTDSSVKQTNPIGNEITTVRLRADQDCYLVFEDTDDATTSDFFLPANQTEYVAVDYGEKISAIRASTNGTLRIDEMTL